MILNKFIKIIGIAHFDIPLGPRVGPPFGPRLGAFWDRPRIADGPEPLPYCIPQAGEAGNPIPYRCKMEMPWISVPQSRQCPMFLEAKSWFRYFAMVWYGNESAPGRRRHCRQTLESTGQGGCHPHTIPLHNEHSIGLCSAESTIPTVLGS